MRGLVSLLWIVGCAGTDRTPAPPSLDEDFDLRWRPRDLRPSAPRDAGVDLHAPPDLRLPPDLAAPPDLPARPPDLPSLTPDLGGSVGSTCRAHEDCGDPGFCWSSSSGNGLCTRSCDDDRDCGADATCREYSTGRFCARDCDDAKGCPTGFACFAGRGCYPADFLDCDPQLAKCTTADGQPGGCVRYAFGAGLTGFCFASCRVGVGSCPPTEDGWPQSCVVFDGTWGGDAFKGPICVGADPVANPVGFPCLDAAGEYSPWACENGSQCDLYSADADGLCHRLCEWSGAQQQNPGCACYDAFGLFGSATPVGLCR
jgi:hypothetical protein